MNIKVNRYSLAAALAGLMLSGAVHAVPILPGTETSLDKLFNATVDGTGNGWIKTGTRLDVNGAEQKTSAAWEITASTGSFSRLIIELAGNKDFNSFGIYDVLNPLNKLEIFNGAANALSDSTTVEFSNSKFKTTTCTDLIASCDGTIADPIVKTALFGSSVFGYYLATGSSSGTGPTFYSDASLNGGSDQMVAFQGDGVRKADFFNTGSKFWTNNEWVLAWEDIAYGSSDKDFNDFVVKVESVTPHPVPEPTTLALLGTGLLFSGRLAKRRQKKAAEAA